MYLTLSGQSMPLRRMRSRCWWGVAVEAPHGTPPVGGLGGFLVPETPGWSILILRNTPLIALFGSDDSRRKKEVTIWHI